MKALIKNALLNNVTLKIISLILGYSFWYACSSTQMIQASFVVPVCFFNTHETHEMKAPEAISITLQASRTQLHALNRDDLALHVDAHKLHSGPNSIEVSNKTLLLPASVKLVHYTPTNVVVKIEHV